MKEMQANIWTENRTKKYHAFDNLIQQKLKLDLHGQKVGVAIGNGQRSREKLPWESQADRRLLWQTQDAAQTDQESGHIDFGNGLCLASIFLGFE